MSSEQTMAQLREIIGQALGEASMCWSEVPQGVFDSRRAEKILEDVVSKLERRVFLESAINGHMEAMRPLLDEWTRKI